MRVQDKPLPGDLVIRCREEKQSNDHRTVNVWVVTIWPDADTVTGGPYQSYNYALQQAVRRLRDRSEYIWLDHARPGEAEQLEHVAGGTPESI